ATSPERWSKLLNPSACRAQYSLRSPKLRVVRLDCVFVALLRGHSASSVVENTHSFGRPARQIRALTGSAFYFGRLRLRDVRPCSSGILPFSCRLAHTLIGDWSEFDAIEPCGVEVLHHTLA